MAVILVQTASIVINYRGRCCPVSISDSHFQCMVTQREIKIHITFRPLIIRPFITPFVNVQNVSDTLFLYTMYKLYNVQNRQ